MIEVMTAVTPDGPSWRKLWLNEANIRNVRVHAGDEAAFLIPRSVVTMSDGTEVYCGETAEIVCGQIEQAQHRIQRGGVFHG